MLNEGSRDVTHSKDKHVSSIPMNHHKKTNAQMYVRNNHVTTVMLHGVSIVCLTIEAKERLCLAQISNTLLKTYSYNEIHNRRVALGITCVQCTPVQLEILRRAGAMPISSRRCGMITKREAERLVKSFLEDNMPPKLPENFSFEVYHECGWGGRGKFEPSRYNSSRAKCIKCVYCSMYFSPNKFIFHFHKTPESKYNHPDAANFNSWRRHLKLVAFDSEDITHAWEDVKAMFNGGSRKRLLSAAIGDRSSNKHRNTNDIKKPHLSNTSSENSDPYQNSYTPFPFLPVPGKSYPINHFNHSSPFGLGMHFNKESVESKATPSYPAGWGLPSFIPSYSMMWNHSLINQSRLPISNNNCYQLKMTNNEDKNSSCDREIETHSSPENSPSFSDKNERFSAFRPVGRNISTTRDTPDSLQNDEKLICDDENDEINITDETNDTDVNDAIPLVPNTSSEPDIVLEVSTETSPENKSLTEENQSETINEEFQSISKENKNEIAAKIDETEEPETVKSLTESNDLHEEALDLCCKSNLYQRSQDVVQLSKEELQDQLKKEMDLRRQIEKEITDIKDALSHELLQERHVRLTLHQKLKEAHEALVKFSSTMTTNVQD